MVAKVQETYTRMHARTHQLYLRVIKQWQCLAGKMKRKIFNCVL